MSDDSDYTRRTLLRASAATAAGLGIVGTAAGLESGDGAAAEDFERIPLLDLSDVEDRTTTIDASEPVPERATGIRPGSQMFIEFEDATFGCTANFVWRDTSGTGPRQAEESLHATEEGIVRSENGSTGGDIYIGAAGHCFLPTGKNASDNAQREEESDEDTFDLSKIVSVRVCKDCTFGGLTGLSFIEGEVYELGEVVYARQNLPDGSQIGHDFGIVKIPEELHDAVDPSMPQFDGPTGVEDGAVPQGETVCQYGAGVANGEVFPTMASRGLSLGDFGDDASWHAEIRASPGDSGSPLEEYETGVGTDAGGILTHLDFFPTATAGTTATRCIELPKEDGLDIDLEVVRQDETV